MKPYSIEITTVDVQPTLSVRFQSKPDELGEKLAQVLPAISKYAQSKGLSIVGQPFTRYHKHDVVEGTFDVEAGIPVSEAIDGEHDIQPSELPGGAAATTLHVGPYDQLGKAHDALQQWVKENAKRPSGGVWEVYLTDPGAEPDAKKWQTKLFLPLA